LFGVVIMLITAAANILGARACRLGAPLTPARRVAITGRLVAMIRLATLLGAAVVIANTVAARSFGIEELLMTSFAILDALFGTVLTVATVRAVRNPPIRPDASAPTPTIGR
jgi:hypothetical protein